MYAWIWRKLPFGLYGKIGGSVLIAAGLGTLLWFVVFPWAGPHISPLESDPGTGYNNEVPAGNDGGGLYPTPSLNPDDFDVPYSTDEPTNTPSPSPSRKR